MCSQSGGKHLKILLSHMVFKMNVLRGDQYDLNFEISCAFCLLLHQTILKHEKFYALELPYIQKVIPLEYGYLKCTKI